jgi:hypothetical protein
VLARDFARFILASALYQPLPNYQRPKALGKKLNPMSFGDPIATSKPPMVQPFAGPRLE